MNLAGSAWNVLAQCSLQKTYVYPSYSESLKGESAGTSMPHTGSFRVCFCPLCGIVSSLLMTISLNTHTHRASPELRHDDGKPTCPLQPRCHPPAFDFASIHLEV